MDLKLAIPLIGGTAALGITGGVLLFRGDKVAVGTTVFAEDDRVFEEYLRPQGWVFYPANNEYQTVDAINRHNRISRLLLMGHGSANWFFNSETGILIQDIDYLSSHLGPKLTAGAVVGLAGCSAARDAREAPGVTGDGGATSFAGRFRDSLVRYSIAPFADVRGHTSTGHITWNPYGRVFSFLKPNQPGKWVDLERGIPSLEWIAGL